MFSADGSIGGGDCLREVEDAFGVASVSIQTNDILFDCYTLLHAKPLAAVYSTIGTNSQYTAEYLDKCYKANNTGALVLNTGRRPHRGLHHVSISLNLTCHVIAEQPHMLKLHSTQCADIHTIQWRLLHCFLSLCLH